MSRDRAITDVRLGGYKLYANSVGDTWDPAWADDGNLYFPGNDGSGWDNSCSANVNFNRVSGENPFDLTGKTVNGMTEYGGWAEGGGDGCSWKTSGCISVDGVLYFVAGRHHYGFNSGDPHQRQKASRSSIVMSTDHGATWTRAAKENYDNPMFPGQRFGAPYFIHYGRDGKSPKVDNAEKYIYAVSNNGFWCNGDNYMLGRVERAKLGRLDGSDWEYYAGGDGMVDGSWVRDCGKARLIIDNPLKCGETGATHIPSLGRYILVAWYYPGNPTVETDETRFIFYESPAPWGPWTQVCEKVSRPEGWYCPRVLSKWQKGAGDEVSAVLVTGGDYYEMSKYYRFTVVPLEIRAGGKYPAPPPVPAPVVVNDTETGDGLNRFDYRGSWEYDNTRTKALGGGEHFSGKPGDFFTLKFSGTRVKWYASKESTLGTAMVSVDGGAESEVSVACYAYCVVPQYGRLLFDSGELAKGVHELKVRVADKKREGGRTLVFNDRVEIFE